MTIQFNPVDAVRYKRKCRAFIMGSSGSGKTLTSLYLARGLVGEHGKIFLFDTEDKSSNLYAHRVKFKKQDIPLYAEVEDYLNLMRACEKAGYDAVILDSCTHLWDALKDRATKEGKKSYGSNSFAGWATVTPMMKKFIREIVNMNFHIIFTSRVKSDYVIEDNSKGKKSPVKIGLAAEFKEGIEHEFDLVAKMDMANSMIIEKCRYDFSMEEVIDKPGIELGEKIIAWLESGEDEVGEIHYGLCDMYFTDESKYDSAAEFLCKKGGKIVDSEYKIIRMDNRIPEIESRESWTMRIMKNKEDIDKYKQYFKETLLALSDIPVVDSIEELQEIINE